jgi:hypothetical protein
MKIEGMPDKFWVVTTASPFSEMCDICFPCTYAQLMRQALGGLQEHEIVGIYGDETEARREAARLLGDFPVRPQDALFAEVTVHVMVKPNDEEMTARELGDAAVEAVGNAVWHAEQEGHQHRLKDQVSLGMSQVVELRNMMTAVG